MQRKTTNKQFNLEHAAQLQRKEQTLPMVFDLNVDVLMLCIRSPILSAYNGNQKTTTRVIT
jgi:hypothetical protein